MPGMRALALFAAVISGPLLGACSDDLDDGIAPLVEEIRPTVAAPGGTITLVGRRFGLQGPLDAVYLGGEPAEIATWTDRSIRVVVPDDGRRGQLGVVVKTEGLISRPVPFEIVGQRDADVTDAGIDGALDGG